MRHFVIAAGILAIAAHAHAQSTVQAPPPPPAEPATPALTKTVTIDPNDSPMVRAAKKAVASRVSSAQRRVVSLNSTNTRGRFAISSGPVAGPKVPPPSPTSTPAVRPSPSQQQEAAQRAAAVQKQLKKLETQQNRMAAEMDEPYGGDLEEDLVEKRMYEIQEQQKKLQQSTSPTPPPPPKP
jgi:hypothetical protein